MTKTIYEQYAQIKSDLNALEAVESSLREEILKDMQANQLVKEEFEFGKFTMASRKSYTYSEKVKELEDKVKIAKIKEQDKGIAEVKETNYIIFKTV